MQRLITDCLTSSFQCRIGLIQNSRVSIRKLTRNRNLAFAVLGNHRQRALCKIAQIVGKIGIGAIDDRIMAVAAILTKWYFTHQEVAQLIKTVTLYQFKRIDDVAKRLRHLFTAVEQEAMRKHALWQRNSRRHQECWPVDCMEPRNVLTDDMSIGRPVAPLFIGCIRISNCRDVIRQGVNPDIHDVLFITRNRNTPVECRARNRKVFQTRLYEAHDLVATFRRHDEAGILFVKFKKLVLIIGQTEEVAFFFNPFNRGALRTVANIIRTDFCFLFAIIGFVTNRIPARIAAFIDIAIGGHCLPDCLTGLVMALFGGANIIVVRAVQKLAHALESSCVAICEFAWRNAFLTRTLQHLNAVFVRAGQEVNILAIQTLETRHGISRNQFISMTDMRLAIWVSDCGGDIEFFAAHQKSGFFKCDV